MGSRKAPVRAPVSPKSAPPPALPAKKVGIMKTSIYLDEDLHRWVKDHAHAEGVSEAEVYRRSVKAFRELEESKVSKPPGGQS